MTTVTILREVRGIRYAQTNQDDTLQGIALRELGDAARWPELVALNELVPPFIVRSVGEMGPGLLLAGQLIKIPSAAQETLAQSPDLLFERDVALYRGQLVADGGDFGLVSGRQNLRQALTHRLATERGELPFHPDYGSLLRRIIGTANGPTASLLSASYAKSAIAADPRVRRVARSVATVKGNSVQVEVSAEPIVGWAMDISVLV